MEKHHKCTTIDDLANPKFLMPKSFLLGEVSLILRRKLALKKEDSLILFVNNGRDVVKNNEDLEMIYNQYKDEDGFLYLLFTQEETFG